MPCPAHFKFLLRKRAPVSGAVLALEDAWSTPRWDPEAWEPSAITRAALSNAPGVSVDANPVLLGDIRSIFRRSPEKRAEGLRKKIARHERQVASLKEQLAKIEEGADEVGIVFLTAAILAALIRTTNELVRKAHRQIDKWGKIDPVVRLKLQDRRADIVRKMAKAKPNQIARLRPKLVDIDRVFARDRKVGPPAKPVPMRRPPMRRPPMRRPPIRPAILPPVRRPMAPPPPIFRPVPGPVVLTKEVTPIYYGEPEYDEQDTTRAFLEAVTAKYKAEEAATKYDTPEYEEPYYAEPMSYAEPGYDYGEPDYGYEEYPYVSGAGGAFPDVHPDRTGLRGAYDDTGALHRRGLRRV